MHRGGLIYDEENRVFRFVSDGTFAFSREYASWEELERRGFEEQAAATRDRR